MKCFHLVMFAISAPRALSLTVSTRRLSLYQPLRQASTGSFRRTTITMMPEGPEVRSLTDRMRYRYGGGRWEIHAADLISGRYKEGKPPDNWQHLQDALPAKLSDVRCKGKFIYFLLDGDQPLSCWSTLGMTGGWTLRPHRHARFSLTLVPTAESPASGDVHEAETLYYYDMRNFGTFKVCVDPLLLEAKLESLGHAWLPMLPVPDSNNDDAASFTETSFSEVFLNEDVFVALGTAAAKRSPSRALAVFLMDQSQTSGIGNYILSEVLFETRTWPWVTLEAVDEARWRALFRSVARVITQSYEAQRVDPSTSSSSSSSSNGGGVKRYQYETPQIPTPPLGKHAPIVTAMVAAANKAKGSQGCGTVRRARPLAPPPKRSNAAFTPGTTPDSSPSVSAAPSVDSSDNNTQGNADNGAAAIEKAGGVRTLAPGGFVLQVYGKKMVMVMADGTDENGGSSGEAPQPMVYQVRQSEGAHKRTVHWLPALQTGGKEFTLAKQMASQAALTAVAAAAGGVGMEPWASQTVEQLKVACRARGLKVSGRKAELVSRLEASAAEIREESKARIQN